MEFASKRFRCSEKLARLDRMVKIALLILANVSGLVASVLSKARRAERQLADLARLGPTLGGEPFYAHARPPGVDPSLVGEKVKRMGIACRLLFRLVCVRHQNLLDKLAIDLREDLAHLS